ncbi:MAG: GGDEF domain-containing protein [Deltaproteobacteria bacterium]|nr:GGDEF domain-containing protein [Deltaproteobacteria bacterium]MBN2671433.1 GGDEF domain-containing protein [Deltaproteobacteria bacterium]
MSSERSEATTQLTVQLDRETLNMMKNEAREAMKPSLVVVQGVDRGDAVTIERTPMVLGRGDMCDYVIRDDGISRKHAQIVKQADGRYLIEDLGSTNGIFIGKDRVQRHLLEEGDKVLLGRRTILKFVYQDALDERYQKQMYESAVKDGLTGVYNRKHFNERIVSEMSFAIRHRTSLSLLIFDLDHFKRVNDTYGHQVGDQVLTDVAEKIQFTLREEDFFARYGGEEFAVLARDINITGADALGERIRQIVQDLRIVTPFGVRVPVTLSIGVATVCDGAKVSHEALIKAADDNLYKAKESGRNRVVSTTLE